MKNKEMKSSLDVYNEIVEQFNNDQEKVNEYINNKMTDARNEKNEWGKYMMSNFWNQVKNHSKK